MNEEQFIGEELKSAINDVKLELAKILKCDVEELTFETPLDTETVDRFCIVNDLVVHDAFKTAMTTPFAIAKYLSLVVQQNELHEKVKKELISILDEDILEVVLSTDFSNSITFIKRFDVNSEEPPQNLTIKYRLDLDSDCLIYTIPSGSWGWEVSPAQLKALLEGTTIPSLVKSVPSAEVDIMTSMTSQGCIVTAGNLEIVVRKK